MKGAWWVIILGFVGLGVVAVMSIISWQTMFPSPFEQSQRVWMKQQDAEQALLNNEIQNLPSLVTQPGYDAAVGFTILDEQGRAIPDLILEVTEYRDHTTVAFVGKAKTDSHGEITFQHVSSDVSGPDATMLVSTPTEENRYMVSWSQRVSIGSYSITAQPPIIPLY